MSAADPWVERQGRARRDVSIFDSELQDIAPSELTYTVTSSVLEQFAQGHTIGDVLRELVQNEYDAQGDALSVTFGTEGVEVQGRGQSIDRAGWRRLSVMLGTGRVVGDDQDVPPKVNGIGSKNHGLRSLFLIGDRIYVRSGGLQTVLDLQYGTLRRPRPDPSSKNGPGVRIFVPYRRASDGLLEAYGVKREERDLALLADELASTLVKLAQPGTLRSLRAVTVSSARLDRVLTWKQSVTLVRRHRLGGPVLQRMIEMRVVSGASDVHGTKFTELEYQRSVKVPDRFSSRTFPTYFRLRGGRVSIGISLRLKRKRPDLEDRGAFYYPLGFANSATGSAISVNAPFEMNSDRTGIVDPTTSSWNDWLTEQAAEFTLDLLPQEWLGAFGAAAYLAVRASDQSTRKEFADKLSVGLRERGCWPTRAREPGSRRPILRAASALMIGSSPELDALVGDARRLDVRVADDRVIAMARDAGGKDFTVASAIRLRCAGSDARHLATTLGDDAVLYYTDFPNALADVALQERFARAFDVHRRQLTRSNRSDLVEAPTTLTAAGTLAAPADPLWVVHEAIASAAPVPAAQRLHTRLANYWTIRRECKPFDVSAWARNVAEQAAEGTVRDQDREALYRYLLRAPEAISRSVWPTLRRAPVVRDHRGDWASPSELIHRRLAGATRLEEALRFPSSEIARDAALMRRLKVRPQLAGADLVRYARIVADNPTRAETFEETLHQLSRLLTRPIVSQLRSIVFLRCTRGGLIAPEDAYVRTADLVKCVGPEAAFAAGRHSALHLRLECKTQPEAQDIAAFLDSLREAGQSPEHPEVLYPALLNALRSEGDGSALADEPVLYIDGRWHAPEQVLVGKRHRDIFLGSVPVTVAGALDATYRALGASAEPTESHWLRFFGWIDAQSKAGTRRLPAPERRAVRLAYAKVGSLPLSVPEQARVFMDTDGRLHSQADARSARLLVNDDPNTAEAIAKAALPIAFADVPDVPTRRFFVASGVSLLTAARRHIRNNAGEQRRSPTWFDESTVLGRLRDREFAAAVHAVAAATGSPTAISETGLHRLLSDLTRIEFVTTLEETYGIGSFRVTVSSDVVTDDHRIAVRFVRGRSELYGLLARVVAKTAEATPSLQQSLADSVFRILISESSSELERYLAQRGIVWRGKSRQDRTDEAGSDDEEAEARTDIAETLTKKLLSSPKRQSGTEESRTPAGRNGRSGTKPRPPLPPLDDVRLREADATDWKPGERQRTGRGGAGGGWLPRSPVEQEEDLALGMRGEELVYRAELERVRALGYPRSRVKWTAKSNPAADHDIHSIADDGGDLWLEVKSTTGRHGRFDWPRAEFELALRARERYVLCRVYAAHTTNPVVRRTIDPVAQLLAGEIRLDISSLRAEVAPLSE
jgi:hypothetical protein